MIQPELSTDPRPPRRGRAIHAGRSDVRCREVAQPVASNEEILAGMAEILHEVADVTPADVTEDKSFTDDLDVDSLSMVEVAMAAEEKFGVKIPDEELPKLKTVGDAVKYIHANN
jgi:acyl carrier protein